MKQRAQILESLDMKISAAIKEQENMYIKFHGKLIQDDNSAAGFIHSGSNPLLNFD
jgi:hypothetical protein